MNLTFKKAAFRAKNAVFATLFGISLTQSHASAQVEAKTKVWDGLVKAYVSNTGGVSYQGFQQDFDKLSQFLHSYKKANPKLWNDRQKLAAYINLYNAFMIHSVLTYAKSSNISLTSKKFTELRINDIKVPGGDIWSGSYKTNLGGKMVNLNNIEHNLIRRDENSALKPWMVSKLDPRIHAAVNCAAISCPPVRTAAFTQANVDRMLDENMQLWLSSSVQFKKVDSGKMRANSIVWWYYDDFDDYALEVLKSKGGGHYLSKFIKSGAKDSAWKKKHLMENFSDRSQISLKLSSAFSFYYNWKINDKRNL